MQTNIDQLPRTVNEHECFGADCVMARVAAIASRLVNTKYEAFGEAVPMRNG
jgi:hypothetical protein